MSTPFLSCECGHTAWLGSIPFDRLCPKCGGQMTLEDYDPGEYEPDEADEEDDDADDN
jgi:hypothetical protein